MILGMSDGERRRKQSNKVVERNVVVREMMNEQNRSIAERIFRRLQSDFSALNMRLDLKPSQVDMELDIPQQEGLTVHVNLNLQGDELHMNAGVFWLEWFPCGEEFVQQRYFAAVQGFLSGRLRIREHFRGTKVIKAELQEPQGDGWRTIGTWSTVHVPWPWGKRLQIKRNAQQSAAPLPSAPAGPSEGAR